MLGQKTLERLFRQHYQAMIHLARTLLDDDGEAEDVVQDVFTRMMEKDILPPAEKTGNYLMTAVRNGCYNQMRRTQVREQVRNLYPVDEESDLQPVERQLERLDAIQAYVASTLTEPHRSIIRLRFDEDLTLREIADRLGMNINTVYKYLNNSIQQIRHQIKRI